MQCAKAPPFQLAPSDRRPLADQTEMTLSQYVSSYIRPRKATKVARSEALIHNASDSHR